MKGIGDRDVLREGTMSRMRVSRIVSNQKAGVCYAVLCCVLCSLSVCVGKLSKFVSTRRESAPADEMSLHSFERERSFRERGHFERGR